MEEKTKRYRWLLEQASTYSHKCRVGDLKLIVGRPGTTGHFIPPPGCKPEICVPPVMPSRPECTTDTNATHTWLFDIAADPYELCNLAPSQPVSVARLTTRLQFYNDSAVPAMSPGNDPASDPSQRSGIEKGSWGPWLPDDD